MSMCFSHFICLISLNFFSTSCVFVFCLYNVGGVGRRAASRTQRPGGQRFTQQHRRGVRSQSKESTSPKDLDLVTKRMLSARLLKINELRNALAELQQRTDELQKENRILRQVVLNPHCSISNVHIKLVIN